MARAAPGGQQGQGFTGHPAPSWGTSPIRQTPMPSARAQEMQPQFKKPFCWWTATHPSHLFRSFVTNLNPKIRTNILEPLGISTEPRRTRDECCAKGTQSPAVGTASPQPCGHGCRLLRQNGRRAHPVQSLLQLLQFSSRKMLFSDFGECPGAYCCPHSILPWESSAPAELPSALLQETRVWAPAELDDVPQFLRGAVTASLCVRKRSPMEGSFCSCYTNMPKKLKFILFGKKSREIHSQKAKQRRGGKKRKSKYKAEVKSGSFLVFVRALYMRLAAKLGMPSSLQKQDLSCGGTCSLHRATVPLARQKTASSFTSHKTVPVAWLWENVCCTVFCILSRCLPDRHGLSALCSNAAPCVCMRSPPGWRWFQILPCVPHPLLQIPSGKTHCLCISKQAPESEAGPRVHCS